MRRRSVVAAVTLLAAFVVAVPAQSDEFPPQVARGITVPTGFAARVFAEMPPGFLPTAMAWGPSTAGLVSGTATAGAALHGTRLYVTGLGPDGIVVAYEDEGVTPTIVATGLQMPLGVATGPDDTLYVSENADSRGRVTALRDTDGDGTFDSRRTVIENLPNGRHQTNGLAFGPDGMLYVANGNATDNGLDCGPPLTPGGDITCADPEVLPWSGSVLRVDPDWADVDLLDDVVVDSDREVSETGLDDERVLVARGFRNIYGIDFDPRRPDDLWTPMNGSDNPSSGDPLYQVDTANQQVVGSDADGQILGPVIEDAGFPSCLYDPHDNAFPLPQVGGHEHPGVPEPQTNPEQRVIEAFGPCHKHSVLRPKAVFAEGHEGTSGAAFERGGNFPDRYRDDLFVAEWGSLWNLNGGVVTGHKIIHLDVDTDRNVVRQREFMTGVLPMDVSFGPNGFLYVADMSGQIHEVRHVTDAAAPDVVTVTMVQGQFVPQVVTVVRGQTVRWVNDDSTAHTVRAVQKVKLVDPAGAEPFLQSGQEMDSPGDVPPGGSHSHTFDGETAVYHYNSTSTGLEQTTMRGTVIVLPMER